MNFKEALLMTEEAWQAALDEMSDDELIAHFDEVYKVFRAHPELGEPGAADAIKTALDNYAQSVSKLKRVELEKTLAEARVNRAADRILELSDDRGKKGH
jgi:hypothetical protein